MTVTFCSPFIFRHTTKHFKKIFGVHHDTDRRKNLGKLRIYLK